MNTKFAKVAKFAKFATSIPPNLSAYALSLNFASEEHICADVMLTDLC